MVTFLNKFYFIKIQEVYFCHQELTQELNIKAVQTQKLKNLMNLVSKNSFWDTNLRTLFFTKANKAALSWTSFFTLTRRVLSCFLLASYFLINVTSAVTLDYFTFVSSFSGTKFLNFRASSSWPACQGCQMVWTKKRPNFGAKKVLTEKS